MVHGPNAVFCLAAGAGAGRVARLGTRWASLAHRNPGIQVASDDSGLCRLSGGQRPPLPLATSCAAVVGAADGPVRRSGGARGCQGGADIAGHVLRPERPRVGPRSALARAARRTRRGAGAGTVDGRVGRLARHRRSAVPRPAAAAGGVATALAHHRRAAAPPAPHGRGVRGPGTAARGVCAGRTPPPAAALRALSRPLRELRPGRGHGHDARRQRAARNRGVPPAGHAPRGGARGGAPNERWLGLATTG